MLQIIHAALCIRGEERTEEKVSCCIRKLTKEKALEIFPEVLFRTFPARRGMSGAFGVGGEAAWCK